MPNNYIARCLICNQEFTEVEIKNMKACPKCGNSGIPASPDNDVTIKINWHELHILIVWAENWARQIEKNEPDKKSQPALTVACIAKRIQKQHPNKHALTLAEEIEGLKKYFNVTETNVDTRPPKIAEEFNV